MCERLPAQTPQRWRRPFARWKSPREQIISQRPRRAGQVALDRIAPPRLSARSMIPRVVAIGGGKGGVGKSLVAANVGIFLATLGKRVVLVDAAFGAANLHIFAGVPRPSRSLAEALTTGGPRLADLAVPTHVPGVRLVGAVHDPPRVAEPAPELVQLLADQLRQ